MHVLFWSSHRHRCRAFTYLPTKLKHLLCTNRSGHDAADILLRQTIQTPERRLERRRQEEEWLWGTGVYRTETFWCGSCQTNNQHISLLEMARKTKGQELKQVQVTCKPFLWSFHQDEMVFLGEPAEPWSPARISTYHKYWHMHSNLLVNITHTCSV